MKKEQASGCHSSASYHILQSPSEPGETREKEKAVGKLRNPESLYSEEKIQRQHSAHGKSLC